MAKNRYINTRFWNDSYISDLTPEEKLLFIYFISNSFTNISGVYEIPVKTIACDTTLTKDQVNAALQKFQTDNKIHYFNGWVIILNFLKHQNMESEKTQKGVLNELNRIPDEIKEYIRGIQGAYKGHTSPIILNLDLDRDLTKPNLTKPNLIETKANSGEKSLGDKVSKDEEESKAGLSGLSFNMADFANIPEFEKPKWLKIHDYCVLKNYPNSLAVHFYEKHTNSDWNSLDKNEPIKNWIKVIDSWSKTHKREAHLDNAVPRNLQPDEIIDTNNKFNSVQSASTSASAVKPKQHEKIHNDKPLEYQNYSYSCTCNTIVGIWDTQCPSCESKLDWSDIKK